jgi:predicted nucleotidyltransferase
MIRFKKLPDDIHEKIGLLAETLKDEPNIAFMYLFGGLLNKKTSPLSDVDIAVYLKNIKIFDYLDTFSKITDILGTDEVDLVVLNNTPISLAGRILQNKKVLIDNDPFLRHRYESLTLRKYFDFSVKEKDILFRRYGIGR